MKWTWIVSLALAPACSLSDLELYALDVVRAGNGGGVVSSGANGGIACGDLCRELFPPGTMVTLTAEADSQSTFAGWSDPCGAAPACTVTMDAARTITARFDVKTLPLVVAKSGAGRGVIRSEPGGVDCGPACTASFAYGTRVGLTATPDPGNVFMGWSGACRGMGPCGVTLAGERRVEARFESDVLVLGVTRSGSGQGRILSDPPGIDCGGTCSGTFPRHSLVTLTAAPASGSVFAGWTGACSGTGACRVTMEVSKSVTAEFTAPEHLLTVTIQGTGLGSVSSSPAGIDCGERCMALFPEGTRVTLTASVATGAIFTGWTGDCTGARTCTLTITKASNVVAAFRSAEFRLTVTRTGDGAGTVSSTPEGIDCGTRCAATFPRATTVTLTATPEPGSRFTGWSGACVGVAACTPRLDADRTVRAGFELLRYPFTVSKRGAGDGKILSVPPGIECGADCSQLFGHGSQVSLQVTPGAGSVFAGWSGACSGTGACSVTVTSAGAVVAELRPRYSVVHASTFTMGSPAAEPGRSTDEGPERRVSFRQSFLIKTTEVTQGEWRAVMGTSPSTNSACGDDCPVESVSWDDAVAFVNALSESEGLERCYLGQAGAWLQKGVSCLGYRLPTEAEWELAARGGTTSAFAIGEITNATGSCGPDPALDRLGWYCANSSALPHPVGTKGANGFGLLDVHGNVAEWTNDAYDPAHYATSTSTTDPAGPPLSAGRVIRGCAYSDLPRACRAASRASLSPSMRSARVGVRPVRTAWARAPAGTFAMGAPQTELGRDGDEIPRHAVTLTRDHFVRAFETTRGEWSAAGGPALPASTCGDACPADAISWSAAAAYADLLSRAHGREPCYGAAPDVPRASCTGYRLPTEAEWERDARAGTTTAFSIGEITATACNDPLLGAAAWYCANSGFSAHEVGGKRPNAWGLFDVHGNVEEWVQDWYDALYYLASPRVDPPGPATGVERVVRGGAFDSEAGASRSASRNGFDPVTTSPRIGVRLARNACGAPGFRALGTASAPQGRAGAEAVWTGGEAIFIGGEPSPRLGARYDPELERWRNISTGGPNRFGHGVVWTGREVVVFGGAAASAESAAIDADGGIYDPRRDTWTTIPMGMGAPSGRRDFAHAWTGSQWVIWGGRTMTVALADGARYVPHARTWLPVSASPLAARRSAAAVWTGSRVLIAAGRDQAPLSDFALYDPEADAWSTPAPATGCSGAAKAVLAGGYAVVASEGGWCKYDLAAGTWSQVASRPGGRALPAPSAGPIVSTGAEVLAGEGGAIDAYQPATDTWRTPMGPSDARAGAAAVWTGCELLIWSGDASRNDGWLVTP